MGNERTGSFAYWEEVVQGREAQPRRAGCKMQEGKDHRAPDIELRGEPARRVGGPGKGSRRYLEVLREWNLNISATAISVALGKPQNFILLLISPMITIFHLSLSS